jgi:hypothetical protein
MMYQRAVVAAEDGAGEEDVDVGCAGMTAVAKQIL